MIVNTDSPQKPQAGANCTHATTHDHTQTTCNHNQGMQMNTCTRASAHFYIKIGWAMWIVVGAGEDDTCGDGTGPGTLRAGPVATEKAAKATCQGTIQCKQPTNARRETTKVS